MCGFQVLTDGFMKIGWMDVAAPPATKLGVDEFSYGFDGHLVKKWHQGAEQYGREWKVKGRGCSIGGIRWHKERYLIGQIGDVVGCFLDLNDRTISFSLNGELLLDPSGSEMAFDNVQPIDGFVLALLHSPPPPRPIYRHSLLLTGF